MLQRNKVVKRYRVVCGTIDFSHHDVLHESDCIVYNSMDLEQKTAPELSIYSYFILGVLTHLQMLSFSLSQSLHLQAKTVLDLLLKPGGLSLIPLI